MPYTPRKSDILYERLEVWLEECVDACMSPEQTFDMLHEAWQYRIERLTKDIGTARNRMYLKYKDATFQNRPEPTPDEPKTGKPVYVPLDINPKVTCALCGGGPDGVGCVCNRVIGVTAKY